MSAIRKRNAIVVTEVTDERNGSLGRRGIGIPVAKIDSVKPTVKGDWTVAGAPTPADCTRIEMTNQWVYYVWEPVAEVVAKMNGEDA